MASYRNFPVGTIKQVEMNNERHSQPRTVNSSRIHENTGTENEERQVITHCHDNGEYDYKSSRVENAQIPARKMAIGGKWGSSFWKDCQPTASQSIEESRNWSEYKCNDLEESSNGAEDRIDSENNDIGQKMVGIGHQVVPEDEMLSDEYYEQDGDDHFESLNHNRDVNQVSGFSLRIPSRPPAPSSTLKKSNMFRSSRYNDEYAEDGDDDGGGKDEDDPDDADFDPDYAGSTGNWKIQYH